jgi:hypothetical protein
MQTRLENHAARLKGWLLLNRLPPSIQSSRRIPLPTLVALATLLLLLLGLLTEANPPHVLGQPPGETPIYQLYLPLIQSAAGESCQRYWDPRLTLRGATFHPASAAPGEGFWCLVRAVWYNSQESGGRRNIFVDTLDQNGVRQTDISVLIRWPDGETTIVTQAKLGEPYAADFPMQSIAPAYRAQVSDGAPADAVDGMGLGEIDDPFRAHHTSYGLVWQWTLAGAATPAPDLTATLTPTVTTPPTVTNTPSFTPTGSQTPTTTETLTGTVTSSATPTTNTGETPTPTPTASMPFPVAEVAGCTADNQNTRFSGTVFLNGQPLDGVRVVFRFGEGYGDWATNPVVTGPNPPGVYTHIISSGFASQGQWSAWLVNAAGAPISVYATFTTDGPGGACNIVTLNFYGNGNAAVLIDLKRKATPNFHR